MQFQICVYLSFPSLLHEAAMLMAPSSVPIMGLVMLAVGTALRYVPPIPVLMPALGPQRGMLELRSEVLLLLVKCPLLLSGLGATGG